jgi:hypothetical protein
MKNCGFGEIVVRGVSSSILLKQTILRVTTILAFLLLLSVSGVKAQNTAGVLGLVTDSSGAVVPAAKVTLTNVGTNISRSVVTGKDGNYVFALLQIGTYSVSVEAMGFKTFQASNITLAAGDNARVDATMEVGATTQTVTVEASVTPILQTADATVATVISPTATQDIPLNGRNFINLVQLVPGTNEGGQSSLSGGQRPDDRRATSAVAANGLAESFNNFMVDGVDDNERAIATIIVKPSIDAIEETRVETNMYSATVGRAGGAVVNILTKSGTNTFHGDAFEFARNQVFDAKDYFNTAAKPAFSQNNFGASLGGPIIKDKAFFFMDYEGLRLTDGQTFNSTVPSPCELGRAACNGVTALGNFSDLPPGVNIFDPNTGLQYQSGGHLNVIPAGSLNHIASEYASVIPTATGCTGSNCTFLFNSNKGQVFNNADARVDYHFNQTQNVFARYTINNGNSTFPAAWPGATPTGLNYTVFGNGLVGGIFPGSNIARQQNVTMGWDAAVRPNLLVDVRAAWTRYVSQSIADNGSHNVNNDFGGPLGVNNGIAGTGGLAQISFKNGGYAPLGDQNNLPTSYWDNNVQYLGDFSWTKGAHTFKFGASLIRRNWSILQQSRKGILTFSNAATSGEKIVSCPAATGCTFTGGTANQGNAFASFLSGLPITTLQRLSLNTPNYRNWEVGEYLQDDWQATRWLTVNLGLRYDIFTPLTEKHNTISDFDPTNLAILESGQVQQAGVNNVPSNLGVQTQHNMFQPRLGFAATLGHNFVLRAGFGTSYFVSNAASPAGLRNAPYGYTAQENNQPINTTLPTPMLNFALACLVPACGDVTAQNQIAKAMVLNFQNALVMMYNITLEKAFGANAVTVGWVGEPARHLNRLLPDADIPAPASVSGCVNMSEPGPCQPYFQFLPNTQLITLLESNGSASYNALNVIFSRRAAKGLTVQANYTYTAALADTGGIGGACDPCGLLPNNPRSDWGFSDNDVRHRIAATVNYQLPFGKSMTGVEGGFVKGWEVNGIYTFGSGLPFSALDDPGLTGFANGQTDRPNMVASHYVNHAPQVINGGIVIPWFNPADFTAPAFGVYGNMERNQLFSPARKTLDVSLFKDFPILESKTIQFRVEIFNITNTPSFAPPTNDISSYGTVGGTTGPAITDGNFSLINSTNVYYTPRQFQFAVKFLF